MVRRKIIAKRKEPPKQALQYIEQKVWFMMLDKRGKCWLEIMNVSLLAFHVLFRSIRPIGRRYDASRFCLALPCTVTQRNDFQITVTRTHALKCGTASVAGTF